MKLKKIEGAIGDVDNGYSYRYFYFHDEQGLKQGESIVLFEDGAKMTEYYINNVVVAKHKYKNHLVLMRLSNK
jgi:hypothetical protein